MKSLKEDFSSTFDEVERKWVRIPVTLFLAPFVLVTLVLVSSIFAVVLTVDCFVIPGLRGKKWK